MMSGGASSSKDGRFRRRGETVLLDHGRRKGPCGYCKSSGLTSVSHGLSAQTITVDDFQDLLDRGWRRSGTYLYKPEMHRTCCPSYTIRLKATDFIPTKEQRRVLKKMERFLDGTAESRLHPKENVTEVEKESPPASGTAAVQRSSEEDTLRLLAGRINDAVKDCFQSGELSFVSQLPQATVKRATFQTLKKLKDSFAGKNVVYTSGVAFAIAAAIRRSRQAQVQEGDSSSYSSDPSPSNIAEMVARALRLRAQEVSACDGHLNFFYSSELATGSGCDDAQESPCPRENATAVPKEQPVQRNRRAARRLEICTKRSCFDLEEYELYKRYQIRVHNEEPHMVTRSQYTRFLVETPLQFVPPGDGQSAPQCGFGSFHQQYRIDGRLVAVGVVDVLPRCLSSKYLFWDPDVPSLSLGKFSALKEIDWVKQAQTLCPSLQYYYLGYYIHTCRKMRYKAAYCPSELLCPLRYTWVPFSIAKPLLDRKPYVVLSDYASFQEDRGRPGPDQDDLEDRQELSDDDDEMDFDPDREVSESENEESGPDSGDENLPDVSDIVLELDGTRVKCKDIQRVFGPIPLKNLLSLELQLRRYARVVGPCLASSVVYLLS